jgi:hypothetical protein
MVKNNQMETGQARRGRADAWGVLVVQWARLPDQNIKRTAPAASRAEESADNSDDLKAVGWVSHERRKA